MPQPTLDRLETPALLLDAQRMDRNIERMRSRLAGLGVSFRPHVKTNKSIDVTRRILPAGGPITVSTLLEADYFARHGYKDILYAVCIAPNKLAHVAALQEQGVQLSLILDSMETAQLLANEALTPGASLRGADRDRFGRPPFGREARQPRTGGDREIPARRGDRGQGRAHPCRRFVRLPLGGGDPRHGGAGARGRRSCGLAASRRRRRLPGGERRIDPDGGCSRRTWTA